MLNRLPKWCTDAAIHIRILGEEYLLLLYQHQSKCIWLIFYLFIRQSVLKSSLNSNKSISHHFCQRHETYTHNTHFFEVQMRSEFVFLFYIITMHLICDVSYHMVNYIDKPTCKCIYMWIYVEIKIIWLFTSDYLQDIPFD